MNRKSVTLTALALTVALGLTGCVDQERKLADEQAKREAAEKAEVYSRCINGGSAWIEMRVDGTGDVVFLCVKQDDLFAELDK